jgi:hypothetical protein
VNPSQKPYGGQNIQTVKNTVSTAASMMMYGSMMMSHVVVGIVGMTGQKNWWKNMSENDEPTVPVSELRPIIEEFDKQRTGNYDVDRAFERAAERLKELMEEYE